MKKLDTIQVLRALACISVVVSHAISRALHVNAGDIYGLSSTIRSIANFGHIGVDLFFVISGFIMYFTNHNKFGQQQYWRIFFIKRLIRLVPIYWILTSAAVLLLITSPDLFRYREGIELPWVIGSYLFVPISTSYGISEPVLGVGWTLNYEMYFYAIFTVCLLLSKRIAIISLTAFFAISIVLGDSSQLNSTSSISVLLGSPLLVEFLLGIIVAIVYLEFSDVAKKYHRLILLLCILILSISYLYPPQSYIERLFTWGIGSALIVLAAVLRPINNSKTIVFRALVVCGDASYSTYLVQVFTLPLLFLVIGKLSPDLLNNLFFIVTLATVGTVLIGYVFFYSVEKPVFRFLSRMLFDPRSTGSSG